MSSISDQLMFRYLEPVQLNQLLVPPSDANRQQVRALLAQVYDPGLLTVKSVDGVTVMSQSFQVPAVDSATVRGTWEKVSPSPERANYSFGLPIPAQTSWVDMALDTTVNVRVAATSPVLAAVSSSDVAGSSPRDFGKKFQLQYAEPPAFNADDPAVKRTYALRVSVLFFPTLDIESALRRMVQGRQALDALRSHPDTYEGGDVLSSSAWLGVFPTSLFVPNGISQDQVSTLFAADSFAAAFVTI
ncbi:hypothetical protein [Mycobacterium sp.]|uniref:hypothetical protein n=1 Tax=Mycobacterium sp. TaxID=1785 RepID=UPI003D0F89EF